MRGVLSFLLIVSVFFLYGCGFFSDDDADIDQPPTNQETKTYYLDSDGDGYGDANYSMTDTSLPSGYVLDNTDFDDTNADVYPGAPELADGIDNDGDGDIDEDFSIYYEDSDGDGYGNPSSFTYATSQPTGYVTDNTDCDDSDPDINPGATEIYDSKDNNCDGSTDEGFSIYYEDSDGDGYGNPSSSTYATSQPTGYVTDNTDCDDSDANINPGATEVVDGVDNNCDGSIDEGAITYYFDSDGDGFGDPTDNTTVIGDPPTIDLVSNNTDCDDNSSDVYPGAAELADNKDNDCDGDIDENLTMLVETGQTKSYDADGNVVTDGSIKDDGYYQAGAPRSYSRDNSTNIVTDETTGLMWQDDTDAENVDINWPKAKTYCQNKTHGGYSDWRLPTIKELATIVDSGKYSPSIDSVFENVLSTRYWSSTTFSNDNSSAWDIVFISGRDSVDTKTATYIVRCVRGNSLPESSFSRDSTEEIVTDNTTGLIWQDNETVSMKWENAINYCESLNLGGATDWRLPNINELRSIADYNEYYPAIDPVFENVQSYRYWSSTTYSRYTYKAFSINFINNEYYFYDKNDDYNVRCVRAGQ
ncbi:Lcl domain-containing protein [Flexistipes sp.]|uniref:Lcl domain-containing protein n=1 Tax=Flexistipes sp. TaxID=3088135 RepID=UPI002E2335F6|nr:DUF1566 domain-containing protein [Flexistipes sp.]